MLEPFSRTYVTASVPGVDLHWLSKRHEPILDAIRSRDPELAADASRKHAAQAAELLEDVDQTDEEGEATEGP